MRGGEHEKHAKEHDVAGYASGLGVVDIQSGFRSQLSFLHIEEVDIVSAHMDASEYQNGVGTLSVEPLSLVEWEESKLGPYEPHKIPAHRKKNQCHID